MTSVARLFIPTAATWVTATFTWPDGFPPALTGGSAPANLRDFTQVRSEATQSCA
jgi:hypothetical protein